MVSRFDFRVNASNILRLAGQRRDEMDKLRKALPTHTYEILLGSHATRGTYVDIEIGIEVCQKYQLPRLEERLQSLKEEPRNLDSLSRRNISRSQRLHTTSPVQTYGQVSDSPQPLSSTLHVGNELHRSPTHTKRSVSLTDADRVHTRGIIRNRCRLVWTTSS